MINSDLTSIWFDNLEVFFYHVRVFKDLKNSLNNFAKQLCFGVFVDAQNASFGNSKSFESIRYFE